MLPKVSIIIPVFNGGKWINDCFESILLQDIIGKNFIELVIFNDASVDDSAKLLREWERKLAGEKNIKMVLLTSSKSFPQGVGFAKNQAVNHSCGEYLCFQDIDDTMARSRISSQLQSAIQNPLAIIGSKFVREPQTATPRFTRWANSLNPDLLKVQIYTSHGPTVIMPTWFCSRHVFDKVGGFNEAGHGTPEDLIFFYKHLDNGGNIIRIESELVLYRFHPEATTFSISEDTIWKLRIARLEEKVLPKWDQFTIWNAGKQGRKFYKSLSKLNQAKVRAFCDVDDKKIGKMYEPFDTDQRKVTASIPIHRISSELKPFIICVKLDMTGGVFETNLASLNLTEGLDYILFN